jgi:hypothetical protein
MHVRARLVLVYLHHMMHCIAIRIGWEYTTTINVVSPHVVRDSGRIYGYPPGCHFQVFVCYLCVMNMANPGACAALVSWICPTHDALVPTSFPNGRGGRFASPLCSSLSRVRHTASSPHVHTIYFCIILVIDSKD